VYSFGILLLEIFTGRRPTDELFKDDLNLHNSVKLMLQGQLTQILDQSALNEVREDKNMVTCWSEWTSEEIECLILVFHIGLACSAESPRHRMDMRRVTLELLSIRANLLGNGNHEQKIESSVKGESF
jgi:hypothetical protein